MNDAKQVSVSGNTTSGEIINYSNPFKVELGTAIFRQPSNGGGQQVTVKGTVTGGVDGQMYTIDFYAGDTSRRFLGRATAFGNRVFEFPISSNCQMNESITAHATTMRYGIGSTSSLSEPIFVRY